MAMDKGWPADEQVDVAVAMTLLGEGGRAEIFLGKLHPEMETFQNMMMHMQARLLPS
jgi:hypothetical protein